MPADVPVETFGTPRRLTACVGRLPERQEDLEDVVMGPPVSAAFTATGEPTPAAIGFARKQGIAFEAVERQETPKGTYLLVRKRVRGKSAVDALPDLLTGVLRDLAFPKQMHWDAMLDDGRGNCCSGGRSGGCCFSTAAASCRSRLDGRRTRRVPWSRRSRPER